MRSGVPVLQPQPSARPSPPLICEFIDVQRVVGYRVELICRVLRDEDLAVTPQLPILEGAHRHGGPECSPTPRSSTCCAR